MSKPTYDRADASALLDDRGYSGALIRGQNPALLFEKGVRERITESYYWKEQCFGLNAATLCDRAVELKFIGGTSGITGRPTPFLCLAFKMLQLVPEKGIVLEMLNFRGDEEDDEGVDSKREEDEEGDHKDNGSANGHNENRDLNAEGKLGAFKYLRCLAAFYIRLAWEPVEIYRTLEPLLTDYRKIKRRLKENFSLTHVDAFVDDLLTKDRICATSLWKMPPRSQLEDLDLLEPRESPLGDEIDMLDEEDERAKAEAREGSLPRKTAKLQQHICSYLHQDITFKDDYGYNLRLENSIIVTIKNAPLPHLFGVNWQLPKEYTDSINCSAHIATDGLDVSITGRIFKVNLKKYGTCYKDACTIFSIRR
ncbi:hypothetical protein E8E11_007733 [Didymella keratinophila]|nr:hypothetical protein E8E11_007733 [Didymella keratinophila]